MSKRSVSRRDLNNIRKIHAKFSKNNESYIIIISIRYSDYSLSSDSELYEIIQTSINKDMNKLDNLVTNIIKNKINVITPYNMSRNLIINLVYLVGQIGTPGSSNCQPQRR